jgi:hypothetical protein
VNPEVELTLDDAVEEVLGLLTGLDLRYLPEQDRYRAITRQLNRALRSNALEQEWGYYSSTESAGVTVEGHDAVQLRSSVRPRIINDDAVRLVDDEGRPRRWAYFLPRDALHKYRYREGLWCSATHTQLSFSRPFDSSEDGLEVMVPVMREPRQFRLPDQPEDGELVTVPDEIRRQLVDFPYPDVVVLRAAFYYAQTDPVMQPRVQTLEAQYKDLMYQIMERDSRNTDSPYSNEWMLPIQGNLHAPLHGQHAHPHADERR